MTSRRNGTTLVELLVSLPLVALLGAAAVVLLLQTHRAVRSADGITTANRELRHALAALSSDLRPLRAVDLIAWSDTSLEFEATVGVGIVCEGRGSLRELDLLPQRDDDAARTSWSSVPQSGDAVTAWAATSPAGVATAMHARLLRVNSARACVASPLLDSAPEPNAPVQQLVLRDSLAHAPLLGAPVRVSRHVRLLSYRSNDGAWYIGRSSLSAGGWDIVQPIAGPILAPSGGGLRFAVSDSLGTPVRPGGHPPAQVHIEVRAPRRSVGRLVGPRQTDSVSVDLTLRADRDGVPRAPE